MSLDRLVLSSFENRSDAIDAARQDLQVELADERAPYGHIYACQGLPRCDRYGTGEECPWCTVIVVRRDGGECVIEPGHA